MPSWPLRLLGTVFAGWKRLVAGAFFVVSLVFMLTLAGVVTVEAFCHVDVFMTVPTRLRDLYGIPLWVGFVLLTVGLGIYGQRRAVSLRGVQAALAARPPQMPGGPAGCRQCGAPLAVPKDAVDVRCIYCSTDNLVALSPAWVANFASSSHGAARELAQADRELAAQLRKLRRRMLVTLGCYAAGLAAIITLSARRAYAESPDVVSDPHWWDHAGTPRDLVRRHPTRDGSDWQLGTATIEFAADCAANPTPITLVTDECDNAGCTLWLYAALREHERAQLLISGIPAPGRVDIAAPHWFAGWSRTPRDAFGARAGSITVHPDQRATFVADWTTWHELALHLPGAKPGPLSVCFSVSS
jgi:LSD1 subclass zinc finger protein